MDKVRGDVRSSLRLTAKQRVKDPKDFEVAKSKGTRVNTRSFTFNLAPSDKGTRLGLVVSKKVGNSPRRNRVKRLLREVFRLNQELFPANCDVIAIARSTCVVNTYDQVLSEVRSADLVAFSLVS